MKTFFSKLFTFISNVFNSSSDVSSKRVNGTFCIFTSVIAIIAFIFLKIPLNETYVDLLKMIFLGGVSLLGLGIADYFMRK